MADGDRSGLRTLDAVLLVGAGVLAAVLAFALLHFVVGVVWFVIKTAVVIGFIAMVAWLLFRRRS